MVYQIVICDDCAEDAADTAALVRAWAEQTGASAVLRTFPSAEAFLFHYNGDSSGDIFLLDVEMNAMSGIELARKLRKTNRRAVIVFTTSHAEFWDAGYEVDALHYLTKPLSPDKLSAVLTKAADTLSAEAPSVILACDGGTVRLAEEDILYAESSLHYVTIHTRTASYTVREPLTALEQRLSGGFFRIHRSYLVSLRHIVRIARTAVTLRGGIELPLARGHYDAVNRAFIEYN